jgi:hypothetical protein
MLQAGEDDKSAGLEFLQRQSPYTPLFSKSGMSRFSFLQSPTQILALYAAKIKGISWKAKFSLVLS